MKMNKCFLVAIFVISSFTLSGCSRDKNLDKSDSQIKIENNLPETTTAPIISSETQEHQDNNFGFSFSYPKSLTFEEQLPYPGGTIKTIGFRVDGITESQLLSNDLKKSLIGNDLYCNLDESFGGASCSNKSVDNYTNSTGANGYKVIREKVFYDENGDPKTYLDEVYAFPIKEKTESVSSYKLIVFTIKMPSEQNLEVLRKIADSVKIN